MKFKRRAVIWLASITLLGGILACGREQEPVQQEQIQPEVEPTPTESSSESFPEEALTIEEPGGASLTVQPGALTDEVEIRVEDVGEGVPFAEGSPLTRASSEFVVDFGEATQIGEIRMHVPMDGATKDAAVGGDYAYLVWTEPKGGIPSVVGAKVVEDRIQFPIVGSGKYQVFRILHPDALLEIVSTTDPLAVPTYQQRTPAWCSPTAMTNVVNYHQGAWQVPGWGAVWGESSNYFLAGKAGQPFDSGYFFHWLLGAGGYTVPADVKQSFSNGNAEVIIWNWKAAVKIEFDFFEGFKVYTDYDFADALFDAFQAYVEYFVWGVDGDRRPVAWGSSLAGHSRTITGSNGTEYYYNDPSSGSLNDSKAWSTYRQEVMASFTGPKIEIIDTVVFYAEPRPANARRGVIWLYPRKDDGFPGSVALMDGNSGQPATNWYWDGEGGHDNGYYYTDIRGGLPSDSLLGIQFKALDFDDEVEYGFGMRNITGVGYSYHVDLVLHNENFSVLKNVGQFDFNAPAGGVVNNNPAGSFRLYGLPPGLYTLKYVLLQNGVYQDVKYVQFRVAESDLLPIDPHIFLVKNAFCRKGPDPVFDDVTAFEAGTELKVLGVNPEQTWGMFERMIGQIAVRCWIALSSTDLVGGAGFEIMPVPDFPAEPAEPVCTPTLDREACGAAGGTFFFGAAGVSCICPD